MLNVDSEVSQNSYDVRRRRRRIIPVLITISMLSVHMIARPSLGDSELVTAQSPADCLTAQYGDWSSVALEQGPPPPTRRHHQGFSLVRALPVPTNEEAGGGRCYCFALLVGRRIRYHSLSCYINQEVWSSGVCFDQNKKQRLTARIPNTDPAVFFPPKPGQSAI